MILTPEPGTKSYYYFWQGKLSIYQGRSEKSLLCGVEGIPAISPPRYLPSESVPLDLPPLQAFLGHGQGQSSYFVHRLTIATTLPDWQSTCVTFWILPLCPFPGSHTLVLFYLLTDPQSSKSPRLATTAILPPLLSPQNWIYHFAW